MTEAFTCRGEACQAFAGVEGDTVADAMESCDLLRKAGGIATRDCPFQVDWPMPTTTEGGKL